MSPWTTSICGSSAARYMPLIGPNGAGKTTCFNLLTKFLAADARRDQLQGAGHHRAGAGRRGAARPGALVPDLGGVSASDGAGERAGRAATRARRRASTSGVQTALIDQLRQTRTVADRRRRADRLVQAQRSHSCPTAQARAGDRHHLGARSRGAAARRADRRHGACGHRPDRGADPARRGDRTVLMVEHNLSVVADLSDTITVLTRGRILAEGRLRDGLEQSRRDRGLHGDGACLTPRPPFGQGPASLVRRVAHSARRDDSRCATARW